MAKIIKQQLKIEGMDCSACSLSIDFDLEDQPGVQKARTSYAKSQTEVEFDPQQISLEEIIQIIKKTGYSAFPN